MARSIILHGSESVKLNPQWVDYQNKMGAEGLQYQRARQQQRMADLQQQVRQFEARLKAQQAQFQQFDNVIVGITPTTNPLTGERLEVWTGPQDGVLEERQRTSRKFRSGARAGLDVTGSAAAVALGNCYRGPESRCIDCVSFSFATAFFWRAMVA